VFLEGDGFDFPGFFHLVNDQGDHGKVKPSGRGIEMKGQLGFVSKSKVELEFTQVDPDGRSRTFDHFSPAGPCF
jgi:hypothetical protein